MHMLTLGYFHYFAKEKPSTVYSISELLSSCSQYLKFTEKFPKTLSNSNMQVKHLPDSVMVWRNLRYLLPSNLNTKLKGYFYTLCDKICNDLKLENLHYAWCNIKELVCNQMKMQWSKNICNQTSFPFNSEDLIFDAIKHVFNLINTLKT